jgi:hypothetical protein
MAAVSVRRMMGPRLMGWQPADLAAPTSAGVKSPSGPMSKSTRAGRSRPGFRPCHSARFDGGDEQEIVCGFGGEKPVERDGQADAGQVVLAALFAGFDGDALPLFLFVLSLGGLHADDGALADNGHDLRCAEFCGLLDDEVHVFAFRHSLREGDERGGRGRGLGENSAQSHLLFTQEGNFRRHFGSQTIEDHDAGAFPEAEHIVGVVAFGFIQGEVVGIPLGGGDVEAVNGHVLSRTA